MAGSVLNPEEHNPAKLTFTVEKGEGKLGGEVILRNCKVWHIDAFTVEGFFDPFTLQVIFHLIGPRKDEFNDASVPGYMILGDWKVPDVVLEQRKKLVELQKQYQAKETRADLRKSYQMMIDYLKPIQKVLFLKSSDPSKDFSAAFGIIPHQVDQIIKPEEHRVKSTGLKKIDKCKFDVI